MEGAAIDRGGAVEGGACAGFGEDDRLECEASLGADAAATGAGSDEAADGGGSSITADKWILEVLDAERSSLCKGEIPFNPSIIS